MTLPVERFKDSYSNWRYNPFTDADMAVDKEEDNLDIPGSSPFLVQLREVPRKNEPTTVLVRCYDAESTVDQNSGAGQPILYVASTTGFEDDELIIINRGGAREEERVILSVQAGVSLTLTENLANLHTAAQADAVEEYIEFTEVGTAPAQGQFRVDYPPEDGEGTGLLEFNQNDNGKTVRVNYKATGSPILEEFLNTKVSFPAGSPNDNQVIGFVSGAPDWRNNPVCYFHEGPVIYHASGEDESCLLFRFKRSTKQSKVILELKGAKLHQGYYTELKQHNHAVGSLAGSQATHTHSVSGTTADGGAEGTHTHGAGSLIAANAGSHAHDPGTLSFWRQAHTHPLGGDTGNKGLAHTHSGVVEDSGDTGPWSIDNLHNHSLPANTGDCGNGPGTNVSGTGGTEADHSHSVTGSTGAGGSVAAHNHSISLTSGAGGNEAVTIAGSVANAGGSPKDYGDSHKVYINDVDKTTQVLAETGLTQFGNGTAGHDFVTTGSGEMDISDLITSAGMWEIKITEPTSAKGGRVLCHVEVF